MTDETPITPAPGAAPAPSVVIDRDAKVAISKRPLFLAIAAVVAFVAFTVVWFAVQEDYEPGVVAKSFLAQIEQHGIDADPTDDELRCIDDSAEGIDPTFFTEGGVDVLDGVDVGEAETAFAVKVLDVCMRKPTRVALLASGMAEDGTLDAEQATCLAGKLDDVVVEQGGYATLIGAEDSPEAATSMLSVIFTGMGECGIDLTDMMGSEISDD